MPTFLQTAEGHTNGQPITTANSGGASGDAWNTVTPGSTGGTFTATTERAAHGLLSIEIDHRVGGGAHRLMRNFVEAGRAVFETPVILESTPTDFEDIMGVRHSGGNMFVLSIGADGKLIVINAAGAGISDSRAPNALPAGVWYTIQTEVRKGTTTANGLIGYRYFLGREAVGTPVFSWSDPAMNAGTANTAQLWIGRSTSRNQARYIGYDTVRAFSLASGWPAPYVSPNLPPEVVLGTTAVDIEPGTKQELAVNASDPDGTIASITVEQVSGSPTVALTGSGSNYTYTAPPTLNGAVLGFQATATDNSGASTTSETVTHTIYPATERVVVDGVEVPCYLRVGE